MSEPNAATLRTVGTPTPNRPLDLTGQLDRTAGRSRNYTGGQARGRTLTYESLWDMTWWLAPPQLRNRGHRRYIGMRGEQDNGKRRQR